MDRLVHKLEFEGPSISFSSRHLAVGVASLDTDAAFNGTTFSAVMAPNASEPQVPSSFPRPSCGLAGEPPSQHMICIVFASLFIYIFCFSYDKLHMI